MVGEAQSPIDKAIERTRDFFFREQLPDGYWWAELESNVTITAEYIMLFHFLGMVDKVRERKMARCILSKQTAEGYWTSRIVAMSFCEPRSWTRVLSS